MGQNCCSAQVTVSEILSISSSINHPQGNLSNQDAQSVQQIDQSDFKFKNDFYGRSGQIYSKTLTKEIMCDFDNTLQPYKYQIISKFSTIREQTQELKSDTEQLQQFSLVDRVYTPNRNITKSYDRLNASLAQLYDKNSAQK